MTRLRRIPALLTAALAAVAHVVLLLAPLTCACADAAASEAEPKAMTCCCKPGDPPMPCSSGRDAAPGDAQDGGGCASARATCVAEMPSAAPALRLADDVPVPVTPPEAPASLLAAVAAPEAVPRLVRPQDTGPPPIALRLVRCSVILI